MSESEEDGPSTSVPSILIDKEVLSSTLKMGTKENEYKLFDDSDLETDRNIPNEYVQFKLYVSRRSNIDANFFVGNLSDEEQYCWTPDGSTVEEPSLSEDVPLNMTIQKLPNGIIINSNVYLTLYQWNTIIIEDIIVNCFICDLYTTRTDVDKHMNSAEHIEKLDANKPMAKYDLSIIRKIRDHYHCGVCNVTFETKDLSEHNDSTSHGQNHLFAVNKVSDLIDYVDTQNEKNDSASTYESCDDDDHDDDNDDDNDNDTINEDDENYDSEWVKATNNNPELSYANKLKKVNSAPKHYDIDLRNKKVKVTYNCWHMIGVTKKNAFYCMACKLFDRLTLKNEHCDSATHLDNLKRCEIVNRFEEYFIRKVDYLYHCGHCNTLQSSIVEHLEAKHPCKSRKISENALVPNPNVNDEVKAKKADDTGKVVNINNDNDRVRVNDNNDTAKASTSRNCVGAGLYQNILVNICGYKISVPISNYNTVITQYNRNNNFNFFCALCNLNWIGETIIPHVNTLFHIQLMQIAPFIAQFNYHMIRSIPGMLHCALCNTLVHSAVIYFHIQDSFHIQNLRAALIYKETPEINVNINNDKPNPTLNAKNDDKAKKYEVPLESSDVVSLNNDDNGNTIVNKVPSQSSDVVSLNNDDDGKATAYEVPPESSNVVSLNNDENDDDMINEYLNDTLNDTVESVIDLDSYVFIKLKNVYLKVTFTSYNTLVAKGDGNRYCFVCSSDVYYDEIKHHVENRSHIKNVDECNFIDLFEGVPLRQMYLNYHCSICNVLMKRSNIKDHLDWPTHTTLTEIAKLSKKLRKNEIKSGIQQIVVKIGKESDYKHEKETVPKILYAVEIVDEADEVDEIKKYKIIMVGETVLKVSIDSWNGIANVKDGVRCIMCQKEIDNVDTHVKTQEHQMRLKYPLIEGNLENLLREINKNTLHCIICNVEVSYLDNVITKHIEGRKHKIKYDAIKDFSFQTNSYTDCIDDVLQL